MKTPFDHGYDVGLNAGLRCKLDVPGVTPFGLALDAKAERAFREGLVLGHARGLERHQMLEARILADLERANIENARE